MIQIDFNNYSIEQLRDLNHRLVDHLKLMQQRKSQRNMEKFNLGDHVSFEDRDGEILEGEIIRFNQKSITVQGTNCDCSWRVSPSLLSKIIKTEKVISSHRHETQTSLEHINNSLSMPIPPNISRNSPCPCGSGKKYKRCCISQNSTLALIN